MPGYNGGRIQKIKLKNFMTYDTLTLYPKCGLNLIVGLNGSGKSSIMCAICLGLAGKPQHTGRASHLSDFIKHRHEQATIELELHRPSRRNVVIRRKIKLGNKSEWSLNGETTTPHEIEQVVKHFNIDTSNLCQFLPQEKVVEFSKMNKRQRLENLLQSIGEPHLFELFNELKDLRLEYCKIEVIIAKLENDKSDHHQKSQRLLPEVEKQEERQRVKEELRLYERRKLILLYRHCQAKVKELGKEKKLASSKVKELEEKLKKGKETEAEISSVYTSNMSLTRNLDNSIAASNERLAKNISSLSERQEQIHSAKVNFENRMKEKENLKQKLEAMNIQILAMQKELSKKKSELENQNVAELITAHFNEHDKLTNDIAAIYADIETLNIQAKKVQVEMQNINRMLNEMDNEEKKKLSLLQKLDQGAHQAYLWLKENKSSFKKNIYGPVMIEIKVTDQTNCKYIENSIPFKDMIAFVCENEDDSLKLTTIFRQQKLPVNIVMTPNIPLSNFRSPRIPDQCRSGGLSCFLVDLFTAPDPVLRYLCHIYKLHNVPVSKKALNSNLITVCCKIFAIFYSKDIKVTSIKSRYGAKNLSIKQDTITDKRMLTVQDENYMRDHRQKYESLKAENEKLFHEMKKQSDNQKQKEELLEKSKQELQPLLRRSRDIRDMEEHLKHKTSSYAKHSTLVIDENEEKEKTSTFIRDANIQKQSLLSNQIKIFQELCHAAREKVHCILKVRLLIKRLNSIKDKNKEIVDYVESAQAKYNEIKAEKARLYDEGIKIKEKIYEFQDFATTLDNLPNNMEEIERKIIHFRTQLNLNSEADESQVNEYKNIARQIKDLDKEIDQLKNKLSSISKTISMKKREWLPSLESHIHNINKNFSKHFKDLNCAGEISLDTCEGTDDFPNYGLQISLKYREDEPFMELSQTHHSGGECSVAAIVFILSLQELTEVPFRCIDEINQGMDSINERKIYQLIADNASDDESSQYFLLTPKLLMDLPYHQNIGVHILHSSSFLNKKINIKKVLEMPFSD